MNTVVTSRRRWTDSSSSHPASPRLLHLLSFLVYLLVSTAVSSEAKRSQPLQASSLAPQAAAASVAGVGTPLDGYSLSSLVLVSAIDGSLTALDRSTGETRWNLNSKGSSFFQGGSAADSDALTDLSSSAFTPLVSTEYGKRHTSLAALLAGSGANDEGGRPGKAAQGGDREGFALDGLPARTRHLLQAAGMYIVEPGSSGRLYLLTSRQGEDDDGSGPEGEAAFGQEAKARLQRVPLTLPELVGLSPFSFPGDKGRVFTGTKRTRLLRIDPLTGQLDRSWEADGSETSSDSGYEDESQRDDYRWAYLARTDYTLSISLPRRPHLSQTLHYSTYAPQSSDGEVSSSWLQTYTNARIRGGRSPGLAADDGQLILPTGLGSEGRDRAKVSGWNSTRGSLDHAWTRDIDSQVVDIFDLLLPRKTSRAPQTHPVIVPHPPFALSEKTVAGSPDFSEEEMTTTEEDTLLTFSPSTGSLYALSSRRFPGVVKEVTPALAGLEEAERHSQALMPGGSAPRGAHHHPMECRTFGCWLGRYKVNEEVFGDQEQTRKLLGPGMGRPTLDGAHDYQGPLRPPLGLPEGSSGPAEEQKKPASPSHEQSPTLAQRTVSTLKRLGSSKKALATQAFALLFFAGFAILFRKGTQIREQLDMQKSSQIVREAGLMWDPRVPPSNGAEAVDIPKDLPAAEIGGEEPAPHKAIQADSDPMATPKKQGGAAPPVDHEAAARALLAEEEADAIVASIGKKKRRKRGKRSGAAVKAKANGAAAANGEDESGSEDERDGAAAKGANGQGEEEQKPQPTAASAELQKADEALQKQDAPSDLSPAVAVAAAAAMPGPTTSTSALEISDEVLGYGSSGTVVFKGKFQSRLVAVKRLLVDFVHLASQEISLLESADDHPNVIRYFYKEQKANFLFIALELCPASLADVVERPDEWKDLAVRLEPKKAIAQIASGLRHLHGLSIVHRDIKPQNILVTYKDPHQPSTSALKMLLSDFGLSKRLDSVAQSSFSQTMHHPGGTAGWRAPEILSGEVSLDEGGSSASTSTSNSIAGPTSVRSAAPRMRLTRGVDIFALGCVTYYLLTSGDHPFGARYEREVNILRNQKNLSRLGAFGEEGVEASHLIAAMIDCDPTKRPRANQVLAHPYFWDAGKRLAFLQDVSDRLEVIDREKDRASAQQLASSLVANGMAGSGGASGGAGSSSSRDSLLGPSSSTTSAVAVAESELIRQLEVGAREVTAGGDWTKKVDKAFMDDLGKWRKYHGNSVRDLLRALRNKKHHYQDMPPALRRSMGHLPDGFLSYFTRRFPRLFLHVYEVVARDGFVKSETSFREYFARPEED